MERRKWTVLVAGAMLLFAVLACNAPGERATAVVQATPYLAPTFTPTPFSVPSPSTFPSPSPRPTAAVLHPTTGTLVDFENWGNWGRGDQANGTFEQSGEQVYGGQFAGKLSYDFPSGGNDFVVFVHPLPMPGTPDRIRAWVYGDSSGHFLNVWVRDAEGEVWQATFGRVEHSGWRQMEAEIQVGQDWPWGHISGPDNGVVDYPLEFYGLALDDGEDTFVGTGVIFIDEITAE